jgi:uncharacterized protein (TIGR02996 family)
MSDRDALLAAIRAQPDEDVSRLMFADYLEEHDEPRRAAFIRAQVELARTPRWEPLAVKCRWRTTEVASGKPFVPALPKVDGTYLQWAKEPFRRGFGWELLVRSILLWAEFAEPVLAREPVGKLHFWHGTLDDWRRVAASECVGQFRELVFNLNPSEPLLALRDRPAACGVTDVYFPRASGAGMPEVLEDLLAAPMGRGLRGLHFHTGLESRRELIDALNTGGPFERLSFSVMGIGGGYARQLFAGPAAAGLKALSLRNEPLGDEGLGVLADALPETILDLTLDRIGLRAAGLEALARSERLANLRRLDLSRNSLPPREMRVLSLSRRLAGLRSLSLQNCNVGDKGVRHLTRSKFWPNLVELDLRQNPISAAGVKHLLGAPVQPELTALLLDRDALGGDSRSALTKKYGDAAVFAASEVAG